MLKINSQLLRKAFGFTKAQAYVYFRKAHKMGVRESARHAGFCSGTPTTDAYMIERKYEHVAYASLEDLRQRKKEAHERVRELDAAIKAYEVYRTTCLDI